MRYVKRRHTTTSSGAVPHDTFLFNICKFRPDTSWKVIVQERERERLRCRRLHFYPKQQQRSANALDRIGPLPSPTLPFLRLRFANNSLICRKPIVCRRRHRHRRERPWAPFQNGECASPVVVEWYKEVIFT